jgi:hypothetical protein
MTDALKPGNMDGDDLTGSIAEAIDLEYHRLLLAAGLPGLTFDMTDHTVRDRRRLFVAIARGIVIHLKAHGAAITVAVPEPGTLPATVAAAVAVTGVP